MRMLRNLPRLLMALLLLGIAKPALAEVFCVDTAWGLQNALSTATANGQRAGGPRTGIDHGGVDVRVVQSGYGQGEVLFALANLIIAKPAILAA